MLPISDATKIVWDVCFFFIHGKFVFARVKEKTLFRCKSIILRAARAKLNSVTHLRQR